MDEKAEGAGRAPGAAAGRHDNGTDIHQWDCYGGATQLWYWNGEQVVNVDSGKCLDAQWSTSNGTGLVQWDCYGGDTQLWTG